MAEAGWGAGYGWSWHNHRPGCGAPSVGGDVHVTEILHASARGTACPASLSPRAAAGLEDGHCQPSLPAQRSHSATRPGALKEQRYRIALGREERRKEGGRKGGREVGLLHVLSRESINLLLRSAAPDLPASQHSLTGDLVSIT